MPDAAPACTPSPSPAPCGVCAVAVGFAAQSTMQNVVSALQIYSTRPFIVGDRVQLKSMSGSTIVAGKQRQGTRRLPPSLVAGARQATGCGGCALNHVW